MKYKNSFQNKIKSNQQANNGSFSKCTISYWWSTHSTTEALDCGPGIGGLNQVYAPNAYRVLKFHIGELL